MKTHLYNRLSGQFLEWALVTGFCVIIGVAATLGSWLWRPDLAIYDAVLSLQKNKPDPDIAIVTIDDESLSRLGNWPWPRSIHARMLDRLQRAGVKAVAMDIIFSEPDRLSPAEDMALAQSIERLEHTVLPVVFETRGPNIVGETLPIPVLEHAATDIGHISFEYDPDGIGRSVYLWEGMNRPTYTALALSVLGLINPQQAARYSAENMHIQSGGWHRVNRFLIPFRGRPGSFTYYSYAQILDGTISDSMLQNKIIFVGASAMGMGDIVPTPVSGYDRPMPGVEVHANVLSALRAGDMIHLLPSWLQGLITALFPLGLMLVFLRGGARTSLLFALAAFGLALGMSYLLYTLFHLWFAPAGTILGCVVAYPLWNWRRQEGIQRYLDEEFIALQAAIALDDPGTPAPDNNKPKLFDRFQYRIELVKAASRRQRDLQQFVRDTLENLPAGVVVITPEGQIRFYNHEAATLFNAKDATTLAQTLAKLPWPDKGIQRQNGLPIGITEDHTLSIELALGEGRTVLASLAPLAQIQEISIGLMIGFTDISALREAQRHQEETRHFLSHDLRSPLASIISLIQSLQPDPSIPLPKELSLIEDCANTALGLADALARLARAESIDAAAFTECDLEWIANDATDQVWGLAQKRHIHIHLPEPVSSPWIVMGDRDSLFRAVVNLLSNAVKYSPDNGEIWIKITPEPNNMVSLSVQDQGPGIAPEHLEKLFRRFSRLPENGPRRIDGIGLGLLMVRTVAERHGGKVTVASNLGEGSIFCLHLPFFLTAPAKPPIN